MAHLQDLLFSRSASLGELLRRRHEVNFVILSACRRGSQVGQEMLPVQEELLPCGMLSLCAERFRFYYFKTKVSVNFISFNG